MGSFLCFGSFSVSCQHAAGPVQSCRERGDGGLPSPQTHRDGASLLTWAPACCSLGPGMEGISLCSLLTWAPVLLFPGAWHGGHFPVVPPDLGSSPAALGGLAWRALPCAPSSPGLQPCCPPGPGRRTLPRGPKHCGLSLPSRGSRCRTAQPHTGCPGCSLRPGSHLRLIDEHRENTVKSFSLFFCDRASASSSTHTSPCKLRPTCNNSQKPSDPHHTSTKTNKKSPLKKKTTNKSRPKKPKNPHRNAATSKGCAAKRAASFFTKDGSSRQK